MRKSKKSVFSPLSVFLTIIALGVISVIIGRVFAELLNKSEMRLYPKKYSEYVELFSDKYGVDEDIIYSVIKTESGFNPEARSRVGACGLMQIMPETYEWLLVLRKEESQGEIFEPQINIDFGTFYLAHLYKRFGNWDTVFAAYNAGETRVASWLSDERYAKDGVLTSIPYPETADYVKKVNNAIEKYKNIYNEN